LRLLDCFGFGIPSAGFASVLEAVEGLLLFVFRCGAALVGADSFAGGTTGDDRNAVGDGMVIVSIVNYHNVDSLDPVLLTDAAQYVEYLLRGRG
jgi:hypothetical protein